MYIVVIEDARGALISEQLFSKGQLTIGRDESNDLVLQSSTVSRHHAVLTSEDDVVTIADCNSANGVFVDDTRIKTSAIIRENNLIHIGDYRLYLEKSGDNPFSNAAGMRTTILRPEQAHGKLVITTGPESGREILLFDPIYTIGRTDENDITLADPSVSRKHARLKLQSDGLYLLTDLDSSNGTWINDKRIPSNGTRKIWHGDHMVIGTVDCMLVSSRGQAKQHDQKSYWVPVLIAFVAAILFGVLMACFF